MRQLPFLKIFVPFALAPLFGAVYWLFLDSFQTAFTGAIHGDCCDRCANILYDREQPVLAFCAAVAFVLTGLVAAKGWKGIFKTFLITQLSFQIYSLLVIWSVARVEECTALHRVRAPAPVSLTILVVYLLIITGFWAALCTVPLIAFNSLRAAVFPAPDDRATLDLGLKD